MILCIGNVLTADELAHITEKLNAAKFIDGKTTAGWHARLVKNNTQLPKGSPVLEEVRSLINTALNRNRLFQMAARPKRIHPLLISRYDMGMAYGTHTDDALMNRQNQVMRSDLSFTLFLNSPDTYEGGELVIETAQGEQDYKLPSGAMIVYPSSTLHRVETVTSGVRLAAISWIQSLIRDSQEREILFDLDTARQSLFEQYGKTQEFDLLSKTHANLLRKWAEC
ncbi:Fe2+-dependent dioxygenase [Oscillatoria sp. CS-180]|uniref:Fe2+-dependent dioxygenase n=1 Tax=Oscillatoria sp. CS-180 TaxID=3021720 RepID=UPI00232EC23E|nr:Fe2+-dependent dioxygenase [Oscillatoria sp. CS-180]MDB9525942.1 Fe2+-dependent dioxygenase [Oscillatoria sp. CS-180]